MTSDDEMTPRPQTAAAMHDTAEQLEVAEAILHRSAEQSPNPTTATRLHALGDEVTAQAQAIDRRADLLTQSGVEHSNRRGIAENDTRELDHARSGRIPVDSNVAFLHTGDTGNLFEIPQVVGHIAD